MIVGKVVEAGRRLELVEIGAIVGGRLDLLLDADADDGGRDLLDDVGEARHLRRRRRARLRQAPGTVPVVTAPKPIAPAIATEATAASRRVRVFETVLIGLVMAISSSKWMRGRASSKRRDRRHDITMAFPANESFVMLGAAIPGRGLALPKSASKRAWARRAVTSQNDPKPTFVQPFRLSNAPRAGWCGGPPWRSDPGDQ